MDLNFLMKKINESNSLISSLKIINLMIENFWMKYFILIVKEDKHMIISVRFECKIIIGGKVLIT